MFEMNEMKGNLFEISSFHSNWINDSFHWMFFIGILHPNPTKENYHSWWWWWLSHVLFVEFRKFFVKFLLSTFVGKFVFSAWKVNSDWWIDCWMFCNFIEKIKWEKQQQLLLTNSLFSIWLNFWVEKKFIWIFNLNDLNFFLFGSVRQELFYFSLCANLAIKSNRIFITLRMNFSYLQIKKSWMCIQCISAIFLFLVFKIFCHTFFASLFFGDEIITIIGNERKTKNKIDNSNRLTLIIT